MSDYREIAYEVVDHVGVITIDRPDARNALTFTTYAELTDAVTTTTARCLVVTGRDPAFCSGDDVKQVMAKAGDQVSSGLRAEPRLTPAAKALLETDVPVIAAVNGPAVGWGMELAIMADIRVCSERAKFGELFVKRGLCCDVAGLARLGATRRSRSCGRAPLHRAHHRRDDGQGAPSHLAGRPARGVAADRTRARERDRGEPSARGAAHQGRTAHARSIPTSTSSAAGSRRHSPSCSAPRTTGKVSPRSSRSANRSTSAAESGDVRRVRGTR